MNRMLVTIITGALAGVIGFGSGALLTKPNRIETEIKIKEAQAAMQLAIEDRSELETELAKLRAENKKLQEQLKDTKTQTQEKKIQPLSEEVEILIEPEVMHDNRVLICGTTNLPVGTGLMITVLDTPFSGYQAQDKCTVGRNGKFKAGPFSSGGKGLKEGRYAVEVLMPLPQVQPKDVQKIIGDRGQYLRGPLVQKGITGITVEAKREFTVGGANAKKLQRQRVEKDIASYQKLYYEFDSLYQEMQSARRRNLSDVEWARFLRTFRPRLEKLREKTESYGPGSVGSYLNIAGGDLSILSLKANPYLNPSDKEYRTFEGFYKEGMSKAKKSLEELEKSLSKTN